jgi:hypothetical protein
MKATRGVRQSRGRLAREGERGLKGIVCMVIECGLIPVLNKYELEQTSKQARNN